MSGLGSDGHTIPVLVSLARFEYGPAMLSLALLGSWAALVPQGEHAVPAGLTIVMVDVGQGDGIVLRTPGGTVHVVDAGPENQGTAAMLPSIDSLQPTGYGFAFLSHFHDDHQGGMDEVLQRPFSLAYDRGDVRRTNTSQATLDYLATAGARRRTIALGQTYSLGDQVTMRCVAVNGQVAGGGGLDPTGSNQEENARSMALRLDYGAFSMWFGGDLTGGGSSTPDVEGPATAACGDVDVYKVNHHGSNTSTSLNLISRLDPELAVVSAGAGNSFGHPTTTTVNRLVQAAALRTLLCTSRGSSELVGFAALGDIRIDTDGLRYRVTGSNGDFLDFYVDEVQPSQLAPGDLVISEIQRNPTVVPDTNGEYFEVQALGPRPLALRGLLLRDDGATVTLASNLMLVPGRPLLIEVDGNRQRNGGLPLGVSLPFQSVALGDIIDTVSLQRSATLVDQVAYGSGFPGGAGIAAERRDLLAPPTAGNFAAAPQVYGAGDRGSPGARNALDTTAYPVLVDAEAGPGQLVLRGTALAHAGRWSVLGVAYGSSPGFAFLGAQLPLNFDPLLQLFLAYGPTVAPLPAGGYRSLAIAMPQPNPLAGLQLFSAHVLLDLASLTVPGASAALPFVIP
jgi:beta-lactamase superfamily II metal-dependent hydrolase